MGYVPRSLAALGVAVFSLSTEIRVQTGTPDRESGYVRLLTARAALKTNAENLPRSTLIGEMSPQDRRQAIDLVWGPGLPTQEKLRIFDTFWQYVDERFAAFQGITVDWTALRDRYRPEIARGVSRGRFAAIMNHISLALRESHTKSIDLDVNRDTVPLPGIPLLSVSSWTYDPSGVCATAQDDGSALVYSAMPNHPLGLEAGDRILGYDGRPWRTLYQELIDEELPLWPIWWGSSPSSFDHAFVMAAATNWHLFSTMDVAKRNGQTLHVPTSLMPGALWYGWCAEQMNVGIPQPDYFGGEYVTWGLLPGTRIGYIYVYAWPPEEQEQFSRAVRALTEEQQTDALIIDNRFDSGGHVNATFAGLGLLLPRHVPLIGFDERRNATDHFAMKSSDPPNQYATNFDATGRHIIKPSYDRPIAVLVGPGAVSNGDFSSLALSVHPTVRTFGRPTSAAFNYPTQDDGGIPLHPDWFGRIAEANAYRVGYPRTYLTRTEFPVDEPVWLTADDVAAGRDTVVEAALRWIAAQRGPTSK